MERRAFLAIALSMLVLLGWNYWMAKRHPMPIAPAVPQEGLQPAPAAHQLEKESQPIEINIVKQIEPETTLPVETSRYRLVFTNRGGSLRDIRLKEHRQLATQEPLGLIHPGSSAENSLQLIGLQGVIGIEQATFHVEQSADRLVYTFTAPRQYEVVKEYHWNDRYVVELKVTVKNLGQEALPLAYRAVAGSRIDNSTPFDDQFIAVNALVDDKTVEDHLRGGFFRSQSHRPALIEQLMGRSEVKPLVEHNGEATWTGLRNRHFSVVLVAQPAARGSWSSMADDRNLSAGVLCEPAPIPPGGTATQSLLLYAGPNKLSAMREAHPILPATVSFGGFGSISRIMLWILNGLHQATKNYGLAIIGLSLLVSLALYPLTAQQLRSMKKMQALQPHMARLQGQHANNPQKLNQEMIALYKKHQVNPLSGCLPLLLQMPILFALYPLLMQAVDLRGAPFLWIRDLSAPDRIWTLPWRLPVMGKDINLLPILMLGAMLIQQKVAALGVTPSAQSQAQQRMMSIMFVVMWFVMFYPLPSGLVLYWFVNTLMMLLAYLWLHYRAAPIQNT